MTTKTISRLAILAFIASGFGCAEQADGRSFEDDGPDPRGLAGDDAHPFDTFFPVVTRRGGGFGTTSITYQNLANTDNEVVFSFIDQDGNVVATLTRTISPLAGASDWLAGPEVALPDGFAGSAIARSTHPIAATAVQTELLNRAMYNGMSRTQAAPDLYVAPSDAGNPTIVAAQNVTDHDIEVAGTTLRPGESAFISGSDAVDGLHSDGMIVGVELESLLGTQMVTATEAVPAVLSTSMAIAQCRHSWGTHSYYEIFNPTENWASANVQFRGSYWNDSAIETRTTTVDVPPNNAVRIDACDVTDDGFNGGALITSASPLASTGEIRSFSLAGQTGFVGTSLGAARLVLPYVRWWPTATTERQRTHIAIGNTSDAWVDVDVKYFDGAGKLLRVHTRSIAPYGKTNTSACQDIGCSDAALSQFGTPEGNEASGAGRVWGGSVVMETTNGSASIVATARTANAQGSTETFDAEDANGIDVDLVKFPRLPGNIDEDIIALVLDSWDEQAHELFSASELVSFQDKIRAEPGRSDEQVSIAYLSNGCCFDLNRTISDFYGVVATGPDAVAGARATLERIRDRPNDLRGDDPRGARYDFDEFVTWDPPAFGNSRQTYEGAFLDLWGPLGISDNGEIGYFDVDPSDGRVCVTTLATKLAGLHPVSGIRCWGYEDLGSIDGRPAVLVYTTGIDTPNLSVTQDLGASMADGTWQALMRDAGAFMEAEQGLTTHSFHRLVHRYRAGDAAELRAKKAEQRSSPDLDLTPWLHEPTFDELQSTPNGYFP